MCFGSKSGNTQPPPPSPATTFEPVRQSAEESQRQMIWQGTQGTPQNKVTYGDFGKSLGGDPNAPVIG